MMALAAATLVAQAPMAGTKVSAELKTKLETKHAHVGDKVTAVTTSDVKQNGIKIIPKGTTLTGHVTEVTAAESNKSPSHLGVLFDQATTKQGANIPLRAAIATVIPTPAPNMYDSGPGPNPMPMAMPNNAPASDDRGSRVGMDGVGNGNATPEMPTVIGQGDMARVVNSDGSAVSNAGSGAISAASRASSGSPLRIQGNETSGSTISTPKGDFSLDSGTRVELVVLAPASQH